MTEGKSVFVKKGAHISGKNDGDGWCVMIFFLPDSFLHKFISENKVSLSPAKLQHANEEYVIELNVSDTTRSFFHSMLPYFTMQPQPAGSLVELKFRELLFNILLDPHNVPLLSYLIRNGHHYHNSLQEVMEKNYMFNLSLEQFAKLGNQSLPTYNREFRKIYKTSPAKWLKKKRLDHAGILLATSTNSVQDIAYNSGFENTTHFSRVFKNEFNIAPLQYRKQKQSSANF